MKNINVWEGTHFIHAQPHTTVVLWNSTDNMLEHTQVVT